MAKVILISLLLSIVYSWETFKHTAQAVYEEVFFRRKKFRFYQMRTDQMVTSLILMAAVPIALTQFLVNENNIFSVLPWVVLELMLISVIAWASGVMLRYLKILHVYQGEDKITPLVFVIGGSLASGMSGFAGSSAIRRRELSRLAFLLAIPPLAGLILKYTADNSVPGRVLPNMEILITVLVLALILHITTELLWHYFHFYRFEKTAPYFRILLGIILAGIIVLGI